MKNIFNSIQLVKPKTNVFDLSHDVKLSANMGDLVPVMCTEAVPGDKFKISAESLIRLAPMVAPLMHRMDVSIHYFFVPNRILWHNWENFITNTEVGGSLPAFPTLTFDDPVMWDDYRTLDYLGLPRGNNEHQETVSALPFAAYQKIWNDYYRDQNLIEDISLDIALTDGDNNPQSYALLPLRKRAWEHDYFTAALPFAQKGDPVTIPMSGVVSVDPNSIATNRILDAQGNEINGTLSAQVTSGQLQVTNGGGTEDAQYDPNGSLIVENANSTINDLRRAFRLQEWLEKAARGGSRYVENILMHFGVKSQDSRLQRPEYITGVKSPVVVSEVLNTTGTDNRPQGDMAGHGVAVVSGNPGSYYVQEHGYIIGVMSVMPKTAYQQGIPKHFLKTQDPFQFYWPSFANIGEQEVLNKEVYAYQGATGDNVFGYVPRYAEYKFENNRVAGDFRNSLSFWHMGRIFDGPPSLNQQFVECVPRKDVFAVTDADNDVLWCHIYHKVQAIRPMPKFGTPSF
jgi:hypothetical protein